MRGTGGIVIEVTMPAASYAVTLFGRVVSFPSNTANKAECNHPVMSHRALMLPQSDRIISDLSGREVTGGHPN